jgi:hypothetical protein
MGVAEPRRRAGRVRMRQLMLLLTALVLIVAIVAGVFTLVREDQPPTLADPSVVNLPDVPADVSVVKAYFDGEGRVLISLIHLGALEDPRGLTAQRCGQLATAELPTLGQPRDLGRAAAAIPDPRTAEIFQALVQALVSLMRDCQRGPSDASVDQYSFQHTVARRRLQQLGVGQ